MNVTTIDARDFFRGISTSDELADGGYSPLSRGINLFAAPGLLLPGPAPTDFSGTPDIFNGIFGFGPTSSNSDVGYGLGSNASDDGKFVEIGPSGAIVAASDTSRDYIANQSDMVRFGNEFFYTSRATIGKSNLTFGANDFNWWTGTLGLSALGTASLHHLAEFGGRLYIADGRYIHTWDGSAGAYNALDLPVGYEISDIITYNNLLFIAAARTAIGDIADASNCRIFTWDGYSPSFIDEIIIQERVETFIPFGGTLFVTTKKFFGYFTGSTVSPLYPITTTIYKYQFAITQDRLYMLQGADVLCFGNPVVSRPKFFSYPLRHPSSLIGLTCFQTGALIYAYASKVGSFMDVNGSNQVGNIFYGNKLPLNSVAKIIGVAVETQALASGSDITFEYLDDKSTVNLIASYNFAALGALTRMDWDQFDRKTMTFQPKITFVAAPNKGVRRIHVFWEPTEMRPSNR